MEGKKQVPNRRAVMNTTHNALGSCHPFNEITRCSEVEGEPLPGSAKPGSTYVLLEHGDHWGHDILDGEAFGEELTAKLSTLPGLYLIRKVGREGHGKKEQCVAYLVFCEDNVVEQLYVSGPEDLLTLDLTGPGRNHNRGAKPVDDPVLLVCTHAKRDMCCALKGRPMAKALTEAYPDAHIWESSHTKGHRFAPSMVLFPSGYSFGRLNVEAAKSMFEAATRGEMFLPGNRGRCTYSARGQVAELAVFQQCAERRIPLTGASKVEDSGDGPVAVTINDTGVERLFSVELERREVPGVVSSCGDQPKTGKVWVATSVEELAP